MSDFPLTYVSLPMGTICTESFGCLSGDLAIIGAGTASAAYPAANRALYIPFFVEVPVTVYQIGWVNGATVNNTANDMDVGIYDVLGNRLVSQGGTIVQTPINALQLADITDTALLPGVYYMAMNVSNTVGTYVRYAPSALSLQVTGMQQQAVGAIALPNPATFANPASAYLPRMVLALHATI